MARPGDLSDLTGWWAAYLETAYTHDSQVGTFTDQSGNSRDATNGTAAQKPLFKTQATPSGHPALYFDGINDNLATTALMSDLLNMSAGTVFAVVKIPAITTDAGTLNNEALWSDSLGNMGIAARSTPLLRAYNKDAGGIDYCEAAPTLGSWHIVYWRHSGGNLYISIDGGAEVSVASGNTADMTGMLQLGRNGGGAGGEFLECWLAEMFTCDASLSAADIADMLAYLRSTYALGSIVSPTEQARQLASMRLRRRRRAVPLPSLVVRPYLGLDVDLGARVKLSHWDWPRADGLGAGLADVDAQFLTVEEQHVRPDLSVALRCRDRRLDDTRFWESGRTTLPGGMGNGVARVTPGPKLAFVRNSSKWVRNPGAIGQGIVVLGGSPAYDYDGLTLEDAEDNAVLRSSFISQLTGWTTSGTVAAVSDRAYWDPEVSAYSCKLTAVGATAAYIYQTTGALSTRYRRVQLVYETSDAAAIGWQLQRSSDSWYWNDSTPGWQAGAVTNAFTPAAADTIAWGYSEQIDFGAAGLTATVRVTTTASDQVARVHHVQLGSLPYGGTLVVTDAAIVTRVADSYSLSSEAVPGLSSPWWSSRGSAFLRFRPFWDAADMTGDAIFAAIVYDGSSSYIWRYDGANGLLKLDVKASGTTYTASKAWAPVRGTRYSLACRWCETAADVYVDGVRGTATDHGSGSGLAATWYLGSNAGATPCGGIVTDVWVSPNYLRDEEIARLP